LAASADILKGSAVALGAQDASWQQQGAYTGETSPSQLAEVGCAYVILGHSERRQYLGESCRLINAKLKAVLAAKPALTPILCVGEAASVRQAGRQAAFVDGQLKRALAGVTLAGRQLAVAYEPIWAIGTGKTASTDDIVAMHALIRRRLLRLFGPQLAAKIRLLYGGSVKADNARQIMSLPEVDGLLVGGASLKLSDFKKIAKI
jgi:triosephosphate isomerase